MSLWYFAHLMRAFQVARRGGARQRVIRTQNTAARTIMDAGIRDAGIRNAAAGPLLRVAVDTHVHLHPIFDRTHFLRAALANAQAVVAESVAGRNGRVWLLLTEIAGVHGFRELAESPPDGWRAIPRAKCRTIELVGDDGARVLVTAGRQVQVEGGLELLVLGSDADIPDGIDIAEGLARAAAAGALPVIPWGFGKWWGRRGRRLTALLDSPHGDAIFLGDNAGRARVWPRPAPFARVAATGRRVLPGSDPLPFPGQVNRIASYGLLVTMDIESEAPFADLRTLLLDSNVSLPTYGRRAGALTFIRDQIAMQIVKRRCE